MFKPSSKALILAVRVLLVACATGAVVLAFAISRGDAQSSRTSRSYACPMHPDVTADEPGDCPICKMELEPVGAPAAAPTQQYVANSALKYICPAHPNATYDEPGECPICKGALTAVPGTGMPDEEPHAAKTGVKYVCPMHPEVTSPTPGRCSICKMELKPEKPKSAVPPVADVSSDPSSFTVTINAEMRDHDAIAHVKRHQTAMEMRVPARMESPDSGVALLHLDEIELLAPKEEAYFTPLVLRKNDPPEGIKVQLSDERPAKWDRATALVRFRVLSSDAALAALQTGSLKLTNRMRDGLAIPESAVLHSPEGPYALVVSDGRRVLSARPIAIGSVVGGYATLISGLREGEEVAATHVQFLDAERRRQKRVLQ